jgi:hypothetical protein
MVIDKFGKWNFSKTNNDISVRSVSKLNDDSFNLFDTS